MPPAPTVPSTVLPDPPGEKERRRQELLARVRAHRATAPPESLVAHRPGVVGVPFDVPPPSEPTASNRETLPASEPAAPPAPAAHPVEAHVSEADDRGFIARTVDRLRRGWHQLRQGQKAAELDERARVLEILDRIEAGEGVPRSLTTHPLEASYYAGLNPERRAAIRAGLEGKVGDSAASIAREQAAAEAVPLSASAQRFLDADTFSEAWGALIDDPLAVLGDVAVPSLVQSAPTLVAAGASNALIPGSGLVVTGAGSGAQDYAARLLQGLAEAGVDLGDPEAVAAAVRDGDLMRAIRERAETGGAIVGAADAASFGIASRALVPTRTLAGRVGNVAVQAPVGGALGAAGEAGAQVATEGRITSPGEVLAEALGEVVQAPAEVVAARPRLDSRAGAQNRAQKRAEVLARVRAHREGRGAPAASQAPLAGEASPAAPLADVTVAPEPSTSGPGLLDHLAEVGTLPRALMASADISSAVRQGGLLSVRRPGVAVDALKQSARAFASEEAAAEVERAILASPMQPVREMSGLYLAPVTEAGREAVRVTQHEEEFMSRLAERVPWVRASERQFGTHLNILRASAFDDFARRYSDATPQELEAWAEFVNAASGRGSLGSFNEAAHRLATVFWSPRFTASRFQAPWKLVKFWGLPRVRNEIAKEWGGYVGTGASVLALASLAGASVGVDPRDSDFGKIVVGNTRFGVWGGFAQVARLLTQTALAMTDAAGLTGEDERKPARDVVDLWLQFGSYKLAPSLTITNELVTGENAVGEDREWWESLIRAAVPIWIQTGFDSTTEAGPAMGAAAAAADFVGVGASTYDDALAEPDVKGLLRRAGYRPSAGKADPRAFSTRLAGVLREREAEFSDLEGEALKEALREIAEEVRREVSPEAYEE